jgi:hypothetical protein
VKADAGDVRPARCHESVAFAAGDGEKTSKGRTGTVRRRSSRTASKHREPHGRQRIAIHAQGRRGVNRQGGAKPRRRNMDRRWLRRSRSFGGCFGSVVVSYGKHRGGRGLFDCTRRRGDLWKSLGEASDGGPQGPVGGGDGGVGKGDVKHRRVPIPTSKGAGSAR